MTVGNSLNKTRAPAAVFASLACFAFNWAASGSVTRPTPHREAVLVVGSHRYDLLLATTDGQQKLGLGDRPSLPTSLGMLFAYHQVGDRCFWMKGMRFALDMIWLSPSDKVVSLQPDVRPKSSVVYCATAEYVVELNAGQAQVAGIRAGTVVRLERPPG